MAVEIGFLADAGLGGVSSVVTSLPLGYSLGQIRIESGVKYKLVHNAGNSDIKPGFIGSPIPLAGSTLNSVTVSTASKSYHHVGAVVVVHATATTASYFGGAIRGAVPVAADNTSVATGAAVYVAANGQVELMPQSVVTGNVVIGVNVGDTAAATVTTGAKSGRVAINLDL